MIIISEQSHNLHCDIYMVKMAAMVEMLVVLSVLVLMPIVGVAADWGSSSNFKCPKAFWIFGDSLTDTGNSQASFPTASRLYPPYGMSYTFRDKPGFNRYSDGRLIVDFVAQAFDHPFYGTYAHALNGANYLRGANFAYAGADANATAFLTPFHLNIQVDDFLNFKSKALDTGFYFPDPKGPYQPVLNAFIDGAYFIPEIGGNDLAVATNALNLPAPVVIAAFVPAAAAAVKTAITTLHDSGARLFFVGNTPPQGCNPAQLTLFDNRPKDSLNCVDDINSINRAYGTALRQVVDQLRTSFSGDGTQIYYIDNYNASIEIYTNPGTYGFTNTQQACCGSGGPYNYNSAFTCGNVVSCCPGQSACATPGSYVAWDGIHYTQAFYRQLAKFFLNGQFVSPALNLTAECHLDFTDFYKVK
ncbi:hypothetical protein M758_11G003400 [Ceratodon purpureus]|uniref:GDSL esterase/lipase n=1 Tax=Ceratodon purpureus TaxID=3225 RepID=A0A8T0G9N3_CERPU|nr:hypothetical protein KC19_11G004100 [Ceratodon purpureus]KAG0600051.1 hypothetical protein M758_11G003400 [Ceratodon purpureus]